MSLARLRAALARELSERALFYGVALVFGGSTVIWALIALAMGWRP